MRVQYDLFDIDTAKKLVVAAEKWDIIADVKYGSILVDVRSLMGVMELIGHTVSINIISADTWKSLEFIKELGM